MRSTLARLALFLLAVPVLGQQAAAPGSPAATTSIDGKQLPAPPEKFGGKIGKTTADSKPYWPARIVPPKGAPKASE